MKKLTTLLITTLSGALALTSAACSSKGGGTSTGSGGTSGNGGTDGGANPNVELLVPSATGFVDDSISGVVGAWFAYGDSVGNAASPSGTDFTDSDCGKAGFTTGQCSMIGAPVPGMMFPPMGTNNAMCTNGTAAEVIMNAAGATDYSDIWGAGIGLDFANPGGDAAVAGYADLSGYTGVSFDFYGDVIPSQSMRVNFPFNGEHGGEDSPYWEGSPHNGAGYSPLPSGAVAASSAQHIVIHWADIAGPEYLSGQTPSVNPNDYPFKDTAVQSIEFQVFTNNKSATPYSFCVANLGLLKN